MAGDIN